MALLPQGCGRDTQAGGLWPGLKNRGRLLPRALGRVQGEQVQEVGDAGHQGEQGGEEGDEENKEDGGSPDREEAGLGGCSRVVVPAFQDQMLSLVGGCHKQVGRGTCLGWWMRSCW